MKTRQQIQLSALASVPLSLLVQLRVYAESAAINAIKGGADTTNGGGPDINNTITGAIEIFSFIIGLVSVIMIMVGAFKYVTSGGDGNKVASGKNTILYALIGLILAAVAQLLVKYVFSGAIK